MTDAPPAIPVTEGDDAILPFQLDALDVRGRVARLDASIDTILSQHAYPSPVSGLLAEATMLTVLIGQTMKLRDRFSIQARGNGPVTMIATDYFAPAEEGEPARIRAYAAYDEAALDDGQGDIALLGEGVMGVTIDQGTGAPYQGITPLTGETLAECVEVYFAQSEQIATRFAIASARASAPGGPEGWRTGGIVIQQMPKASPYAAGQGGKVSDEAQALMTAEAVAGLTGQQDAWANAALKLATVEEHELLGPHVSPERLLLRLFHEDAPRVFAPQTVAFGCTCARQKLEDVLRAHPREQLLDMAENGRIAADCQFCGAHYGFDVDALTPE